MGNGSDSDMRVAYVKVGAARLLQKFLTELLGGKRLRH